MGMRPYAFRFSERPQDSVGVAEKPYAVDCEKKYGNMRSVWICVSGWVDAVRWWRRMCAEWAEPDTYAAWRPITPTSVAFTDTTGEHTIDELFGKALAQQGVLL